MVITRLLGIISYLIQVNVEDININKPFIELGADSIIIVNAIKKIQTEFGIKIAIRRLFEDLSTINKLAIFLEDELAKNNPLVSLNKAKIKPLNDSSIPENKIKNPFYNNSRTTSQLSNIHQLLSNQLVIIDRQLKLIKKYKSISLKSNELINPVERSLPYINQLKNHFTINSINKELMSYSQQKLYNIAQINPHVNLVYNVSITLYLSKSIDITQLNQAINNLLTNNPILNTHFNAQYEVINKKLNCDLVLTNLSNKTYTNEELKTVINEDSQISFDLNTGPLIRFKAINLLQGSAIIISAHHSIVDGWSMGLLIEEFLNYYFVDNFNSITRNLFSDYQIKLLEHTHEIQNNNSYWVNKLNQSKHIEPLSISYFNRKEIISKASKYSFVIEKSILNELKQMGSKLNGSLFMLLFTSYQILLNKLSQKDEFIINMAHSGRFLEEYDDFIGFSSQIIPTIAKIKSTDTFVNLFDNVKTEIYDALEHQAFSFAEVCKNFETDPINFPFSNYHFNMERGWDDFNKFNQLTDILINPSTYIDYDFMLNIVEYKEELRLDINYNAEIFSNTEIEGIAYAFETLLKALINYPNSSIADLKLQYLNANEYEKIVYTWNQTYKEYPENKTIHQLFEEQVEKTPDNIAIVYKDIKLTYKELNERSNQLAHYLRDKYQIVGDDLICLCLDRSEYMLIAILGVFKSGGAYVPIDPSYPDERISYILNDTKTKIIIVNETHESKLKGIIQNNELKNGIELIDDKILQKTLIKTKSTNPKLNINSHHLAYVIYTSGTTGNPKGVMIEHKGPLNLIFCLTTKYRLDIGSNEVILQLSNYIFDASVEQMFLSLLNGYTLLILPEKLWQDQDEFYNYLNKNKVTHIDATPSFLSQYDLNKIISLKRIISGGEFLTSSCYNKLRLSCSNIINEFGLTECSIVSTINIIHNGELSIGRPIFNTKTYILDHNLNFVPIGAIGELYIGGVGLARGYLNLPKLTAEKFINNPFQSGEEKLQGKNVKMYKTGDLVRYHSDGNIEYIGRTDFQVKINGYRIELSEIESQLSQYPGINQSVVLIHGESTNKYIVGYYVSNSKLPEELLLVHLTNNLPAHMIPSFLIWLEKLPLTINGKLDLKVLPKPMHANNNYVAPINQIEHDICEIYSKVLNLEINKISTNEKFFKLGGNSISLITIANQINNKYNVKLSVAQIFLNQTISKICQQIQKLQDQKYDNNNSIIIKANSQLEHPFKNNSFYLYNNSLDPKFSFDFSMYLFGNYQAEYTSDKYDLIFKTAKFADENNFTAVWVPERHFHAFGGFSPNPAVICAAIARETKKIKLRPGSVVIPLHNPIRVAEEWAMVDNLSGGRVDGMGVAIGWHADDFVLNPEIYGRHPELLKENLLKIQQLWSGQELEVINGTKNQIKIKIFPQPSTTKIPVWFTIVDNPETYSKAGASGANVLTNLMAQSIEKLESNIQIYRKERIKYGFEGPGKVTLLLHTFILDDIDEAINIARGPFCDYLKITINLFKNLAKAQGIDFNYDELSEDDINYYLNIVFEKYVKNSALIGNVASCIPILDKLLKIGVNEIAFFVDFGIAINEVERSLPYINQLKNHFTISSMNNELMSYSQQKLYNIAQINPHANLVYNVSITLYLSKSIDITQLNQAINNLLTNNPILNTHFNAQYEVINKKLNCDLVLTNLSNKTYTNEELKTVINEDSQISFDLNTGPLIRFKAINLLQGSAIIISAHHSIVDGWSMGLLIEEFLNYYFVDNFNSITRNLFSDYQIKLLEHTHEIQNNNSYWVNKLNQSKHIEPLSISYFNRKEIISKASKYSFVIEKSILNELKQMGSKLNGSLFMLLFTSYQILLNKLSQKDEFIINMAHSGRFLEEYDDFIGFSSQVIPITAKIELTDTFVNLFDNVKTEIYDALEHQAFSFAEVCKNFETDPINFPFSNYHFNMERGWDDFNKFNQLTDILINPLTYIDYDFMLNIVEYKEELRLDINYNAEIFSNTEIEGIAYAFETLLKALINYPNSSIADLKLQYLNANEYEKIVYTWNQTYKEYPENKTIHQLFEEQVEKTPDNIAIVYKDIKLTYKELNERSNQLAHYLRDKYQIVGDDLICLCLDRSEYMLIAILGVLKSGGAYVPIDPSYPDERISYILNDIKTKVLLTNEIYNSKITSIIEQNNLEVKIELIDNKILQKSLINTKGTNPKLNINSHHLAYVIYTSGTTGNPKGVMIEHTGAISLKYYLTEKYKLGCNHKHEVILQFANYVFDASVEQILLSLLNGYVLLMLPEKLWQDQDEFYNYLNKNKVTHIHATPSFLEQYDFAKIPSKIRVISGGERLTQHCYKQLSLGCHNVINKYGPTETTITSLIEIILNGKITIGKPVANTSIYILDSNLNLLPIGAVGELYIGGVGLARGYLNLPKLTAEKFINNPFQSGEEKHRGKNVKMYKTGDLVRYHSDGNIEYIGRNDFQVKIRGFRVELGEIESKFLAYPNIKQVAILANVHNDNKNLVGYYVSENKLDEKEVFNYLNRNLPEYMVPSSFIWLDSLPLTINGKLDRKALPNPEFTSTDCYVAPSNEIEREICKIYSEALSLDINKISINDDFFKLGGSSITLISLSNKINSIYKTQLSVSQLFQKRTIFKISKQIQELQNTKYDTNSSIIIKANSQLKNPLIFIHPGHAGAEVYLDLIAKLPNQIPCYVIDSYNLYNLDNPLTTIENMAKYYINQLDQNNVKGPYQFVGWSLGGIIAAEMSKQLIIRGEMVCHLHLLDSFIYFNDKALELAKKCQDSMQNYIFNQNVYPQLNDNQIKTFEIESNAMINYNFQDILNVNTTLYKAKELFDTDKMPLQLIEYVNFVYPLKDNGWGKYLPKLEIIPLNCDHYKLLLGSSLNIIIKSIISVWEKYADTDKK